MSKPINPAAIGGFTLGALALLVIGLLIFGGGQSFKADKMQFVVFFDSSLNGLEVGAPVKMQGVKIGEVKEISLLFDPKRNKVFKPVVVEIDRGGLNSSGGSSFRTEVSEKERKADLAKMVDIGFRARLEMQSLLTGLLYVDLDVHPGKLPVFTGLEYKGMLEIPGLPTATDELRNTAEQVAEKLRSMPLDQIVQDFADSLREIKRLLASDDLKKTQVALANTLQDIESTMHILNSNLEPLLQNTTATMVSTEALVKDTQAMVKQLHNELPKVFNSTDKTLQAATTALNRAEESMRKVGDAVGPESALSDTLLALKQAARAIRDLGEYLERHPEALISGKEN
ncbi:MCE family protein [Methylomonas sp. LL1]|uniref:MlaD family protein n=1 Tax=Methylomonas sp. LL1 TaxID=2785785 RepID=UPI0018C3F9EC|nr:MlaD family protein [Methylomonas sp. LL1]QPK61755.1 MCE family protein [Methylomonas sp. LL1]